MKDIAELTTDHFMVSGEAGTFDLGAEPPKLYAEATYVVRPKSGSTIHSDLGGALKVLPGAEEGHLCFGNFVGLADLNGRLVRVDSRRISVSDADLMLEQLVSAVAGLPTRAISPVGAAYDRPQARGAEVDLFAYLVVRDGLRNHVRHDVNAAMARILARPHERLSHEQTDRPIWMTDSVNAAVLTDLVSRPAELTLVPESSTLAAAAFVTSAGRVLPTRVRLSRSVPTTDTVENRFVATVLDLCLTIVRAVGTHAAWEGSPAMKHLQAEAQQLATSLEAWRRHRVLESLEAVGRLPTTSTVLRGRPGYRDILRFYADLIGRTQLIPAAALVRMVGLRDIAHIYEWWCLFQVLAAASATVGQPIRVDPPRQTWQGAELGEGLTATFPHGVRVEFNRRFSRSGASGCYSYSLPLRPDILLVTPTRQHVFDAKFAFEPRSPIPNDDEDDQDDSPSGRARRWHLHKMHTYRDALDLESVRVLYPGSVREWYPVGSSTPSSGVGSLPLRVDNAGDVNALQELLGELVAA